MTILPELLIIQTSAKLMQKLRKLRNPPMETDLNFPNMSAKEEGIRVRCHNTRI